MNTLKRDEIFELAEKYVCNTGVSVFLTGKAGTGKTTFLKYIVGATSKRCVVLAPTGVAAINAGGVTIHSFLQLPLCPYLPDIKELVTEYQMPDKFKSPNKERLKIIRTLDLMIIDEISMVRADLLDAVDATMRRLRRSDKPFGGVQLLMIGDLQQLPPVVTDEERPLINRVYQTPFFFSSKVMSRLKYVTVELNTIYRQSDVRFLALLNNIRENKFDRDTLTLLNSRYHPGFEPKDDDTDWIRLTTHNYQADNINRSKLEALKGKLYSFEADIEGNFPENSAPIDLTLQLKVGAQVMFVRNDSSGEGRYFNGKIATVTNIDSDEGIIVEDREGRQIEVSRDKWDNLKYEIDKDTNEITQVVDGTFVQYPLKAAWAITIHKSQGITFDRGVIDASKAFTFGQVYVALSRCRTLEGIILSSPISQSVIFSNSDVTDFAKGREEISDIQCEYNNYCAQYYFEVLEDCFDLSKIKRDFLSVNRIYQERLSKLYPLQAERFSALDTEIASLNDVSVRFHQQLYWIEKQIGTNLDDSNLKERVSKAADYFVPILSEAASACGSLFGIEIDNKQDKKDFKEATRALMSDLGQSIQCLKQIQREGFSIESYLKTKSDALLNSVSVKKNSRSKSDDISVKEVDAHDVYTDNRHPELVERLIEWRTEKYIEQNVPAYVILHQKTLLQIADCCPTSKAEFLKIPGIGKNKWERYGEELLELCKSFYP